MVKRCRRIPTAVQGVEGGNRVLPGVFLLFHALLVGDSAGVERLHRLARVSESSASFIPSFALSDGLNTRRPPSSVSSVRVPHQTYSQKTKSHGRPPLPPVSKPALYSGYSPSPHPSLDSSSSNKKKKNASKSSANNTTRARVCRDWRRESPCRVQVAALDLAVGFVGSTSS